MYICIIKVYIMTRYNFLKVSDGRVVSINEAGNQGVPYYNGSDQYGKAVRADWSDMGEGYVQVYTDKGKILIIDMGGNIRRVM